MSQCCWGKNNQIHIHRDPHLYQIRIEKKMTFSCQRLFYINVYIHVYCTCIILYEGFINPAESNNMVQYLELRELSHGRTYFNCAPTISFALKFVNVK